MSTLRGVSRLVAIAAALLGASCGGGGGSPTTPPPPPPPPVLTAITISGETTVAVGASLSLTAIPKDQNGSAIAVTINWTSGSAGVATVSSSGVVTGVAPGTAVITATSGSVSATATITVPAVPVLTSITLSGGTTVVAGAALQLTAAPKDQNGGAIAAAIVWATGATGVATVSGSGVVTGVSPGTAVITATAGGVSGSVPITVAAPVLTTITLSGGTSVVVGQTLQLAASAKDQVGNLIAATPAWLSSAAGIATVSSTGLVTGVAAGTAIITATSAGVVANATISVTPTPPVLSAIVISGSTTVVAHSALQLTGSPKDQFGNAFAAPITWSSNATGIATVGTTGLVTGVSSGTATITASSGSISAGQLVTVTPQILTTIAISGGSSVQVGQELELVPTSRDQNGLAMTAVVTWASDATTVASVNSNGVVAGILPGTANITASFGLVSSSPIAVSVTPAPVFPASANVDATPGAIFSPATVDIARNGTVNWVFASLGHTVFFDTVGPGTPADISATTSNATVSRGFTTAGTYNYHCIIHAGMTGTVIVH